MEAHLTSATKARSYMKGQTEASKKDLERVYTLPDGSYHVPPIGTSPLPCTKDITVHFSFDFAQQVGPVHNNNTKFIDFIADSLPS